MGWGWDDLWNPPINQFIAQGWDAVVNDNYGGQAANMNESKDKTLITGAAVGGGAYAAGAGGSGAAAAGGTGTGATATGATTATGAGMGFGDYAGLIGAGLNYYGAQQANAANKDMTREQMDWQTQMSNTSHQREVNDLKAAGLNPILSVNAGASQPSNPGAAPQQNPFSGAIATAMEAKQMQYTKTKMDEELKNMASQRKLTDAQKLKTDKESRALETDAVKGDIWGYLKNKLGEAQSYSGKQISEWNRQKAVDAENGKNLDKKTQQRVMDNNNNRKIPNPMYTKDY